jgi:hypothetical protein
LQRDGKVKAKVSLEKITVAEVEYSWQLRHAWRADPDIGMEGISVSVWLRPGFTRELVIDFPFSEFGLDRSPKRAKLVAALMAAIRASIAAGWRPESLGSVFRFQVPDD